MVEAKSFDLALPKKSNTNTGSCEFDELTKNPRANSSAWRLYAVKNPIPRKHQEKHPHLAGETVQDASARAAIEFCVAGTLTVLKRVRGNIDTCEKVNCERRRMPQGRTSLQALAESEFYAPLAAADLRSEIGGILRDEMVFRFRP
jgi:hypothetical protein